VSTNANILIVGPDPKLRREFADALAGIAGADAAVIHSVADARQGIEAARSRRPDVAFVQMDRDLRGLQVFAAEVASASPETAVVAVFSPEVFGHEASESTVLIAALRSGVRDFLRRPVSSGDLGQLLERLLHRSTATGPARLGSVVCFISNKGGVGKSTMAVNVGTALALRHPRRVLLVDVSLQMGVCANLLDLQPETSLTDAVRERDRLDETLLRQLAAAHPCGIDLLAAPADAVEAAEIDDEVMARILSLARRTYDFVIVDSFPLLDRVMMSVLDVSDRAFTVLDSLVPTVVGAAKLLQLLTDLGYPPDRQRVILNRYARFPGSLNANDVALRLGREIDFIVPYQKRVLVAANVGRPHILDAGRLFNRFRWAIDGIVRTIESVQPSLQKARAGKRGEANVRDRANGELVTE
jgi:pilus assembly protein CpaE